MIKFLHLTTGDYIVSEVEDDGDLLVLHNPAICMIAPEGMMMMPYPPIPTSSRKFAIRKDHALIILKPHHEIENAYRSKFGSGIQIATTMPDVPNGKIVDPSRG